ncbi:unnamed protein product [Aureobasidium uvarum]|uniref:Uncharacterized protein n=1 Tax=Aureobasidium uvarum TaxID=2773716 RepID=A0A9N8KEH5_9PEZI|nr:unnamed protein product [Aureobasidium uvarum]
MPPSHRCTLCPQSRITQCNSELNMKSHLGAMHNMGPYECLVTGCGRRTNREDRNEKNHMRPSDHPAQWHRPQALANALTREASACRQAFVAAHALPPPAAAQAPAAAALPSPVAAQVPPAAAQVSAVDMPPLAGLAVSTPPAAAQAHVIAAPAPVAGPSTPPTAPAQGPSGGAPTRAYLNPVALHMMEGLKRLSVIRPDNPRKMLGEYLLRRHAGQPDDQDNILPRAAQSYTGGESWREYYHRTGIALYLVEGNRYLAHYKPQEPLKWLGQYLVTHSAEHEG